MKFFAGRLLSLAAAFIGLAAPLLLAAVEYDGVTVTRLPDPDSSGGFMQRQYRLHEYRIENRNLKPARVVIRLSAQARQFEVNSSTVRIVPPGATQTVLLGWPALSTFYISVPTETVSINGEQMPPLPLPYRSISHRDMPRVSPLIPENNVYRALIPDFKVASTPVALWGDSPLRYAGLKTIIISSEDHPPVPVATAIRDAVRSGCSLFIIVPAEAPWPEEAGPEPPSGFTSVNEGFGRIITARGPSAEVVKRFEKENLDRRENVKLISESAPELQQLHGAILFSESDDPPLLNSLGYQVNFQTPPLPLRMITLVMLGFIIVIGPLNYLLLRRRRRVLWLLVTTPVISLLFCAAVIIFITFSEGWYSRGSSYGITLLDQEQGYAATLAAVGIYAPLPPGDFKFDNRSCITLSSPGGALTTDFSDGQLLAGTMVQPRIPFSYEISRVEPRREQLRITRNGDAVEVVNGLGVELSSLWVTMPDGSRFRSAGTVAPGEKTTLKAAGSAPTVAEADFQPHSVLDVPASGEKPPKLPGSWYLATTEQPAFFHPGVELDELKSTHLIVGKFKLNSTGSEPH